MSTYIYWIHYPEHTDPLTEGYIGVTTNPTRRFKQHSLEYSSHNPRLYRAIKKGAIQTILETLEDKEEAFLREETYRPVPNIGFNLNAGGAAPPAQWGHTHRTNNGQTIHSEEHKKGMSERFGKLKWYNNGVKNIRVHEGEEPEGYSMGRLSYKWSKEKRKSTHYWGEVTF
jgi:predicted GIY-YIG superfamily endonuclease